MAGLYIKDIQSTAADFGKGSQRDLLDAITMVDAKETPFMAMVPKGSAPINALYEWPVDIAEAPDDNAVKDGDDVTSYTSAQDNYDVMSNRVQWFRRQAKIGKLAQNVQNQAGIKDHYAYAVQKRLLQLKRDAEVRFCANNIMQDSSTSAVYYSAQSSANASTVNGGNDANKTRSLGEFLNPGTNEAGIPAAYKATDSRVLGEYYDWANTAIADTGEDATASSLTESQVESVLQAIYEETGKTQNLTFLCGPNLKKRFKDFTQTQFGTANHASAIRSYNADLKDKRIISTVDVYEGDFGTLELVPTLWNAYPFTEGKTGTIDADASERSKGTGYVLDMNLLELRFNQLPQVQELPDQGGGRRFAVDMIAGLCVKNPKGLGAVFLK